MQQTSNRLASETCPPLCIAPLPESLPVVLIAPSSPKDFRQSKSLARRQNLGKIQAEFAHRCSPFVARKVEEEEHSGKDGELID